MGPKPGSTGAALLPSHASEVQYLRKTRLAAARRGSWGLSSPEKEAEGVQPLEEVREGLRAAQDGEL